MNYRNFVIDSCGLRLLDFLGSFSFIALTSDEYRFNFNPILFGTCSLYNTKYEYAIKPYLIPIYTSIGRSDCDITLNLAAII